MAVIKKFLIILCIPLFSNCEFFEAVGVVEECFSTTGTCGSILLDGAAYPLYFNINNDEGEQCYYKPVNQGAIGQYAYVSNDKCDCACVRLAEGAD